MLFFVQNYLLYSFFNVSGNKQKHIADHTESNKRDNGSMDPKKSKDEGILILLDDNMWLQSMRKKVFNICRESE